MKECAGREHIAALSCRHLLICKDTALRFYGVILLCVMIVKIGEILGQGAGFGVGNHRAVVERLSGE
ncbi:MAG TPA: hypothetical protein DCW95_03490 [Chryseobacterium sp.]|nr:hypothetical protein [Chryseobacterium sp.]